MRKISYCMPSIGEREIQYVTDAITNGWGSHCYDYIFKFQNLYKEYLQTKYAIATSSCTGALHIALKTAGIGPGDEVIVPDATWIASVAPITYLGATPVFVDVLEDTWCIDPCEIEKSISQKTKAIIAVHLYGSMCEMDEIMALAKKHNLIVIEDAAEAIGSEYKGKKAGSIGDFGVFSFHGTKTLTTGEGGMLVTSNDEYYQNAMILHDHGRDPKIKKTFWAEKIGFKYKISNIQAALGCAQVERSSDLVDEKINIFELYKKELQSIDGITMNIEQGYVRNSYWMPTLILGQKLNIERDQLISHLNDQGIDARPFFYPVSEFPEFSTLNGQENPISKKLGQRGINLPSSFGLTLDDIQYVSEHVRSYLG